MDFEISLDGLRFHAFHGVFPQESKVGNEFIVDLSVRIPFSEKTGDDSLDSTISYADLYFIVADEMKKPRKLMETVAASIRARIADCYPQVLSGSIRICKTNPPIPNMCGSASVRLIF